MNENIEVDSEGLEKFEMFKKELAGLLERYDGSIEFSSDINASLVELYAGGFTEELVIFNSPDSFYLCAEDLR